MMQNKLSPLEELHREKEIVRREVKESESRLSEHWEYVSDNAVPILFNGTVNAIANYLGFGGNRISSHKAKEIEDSSGSSGIFQNVFGVLSGYYPLIWEIARPMLFRYAMKKIRSLFSSNKKKRKNDDD